MGRTPHLLWQQLASPGQSHYFSLYWYNNQWVWTVDVTVVNTLSTSPATVQWGEWAEGGLERYNTTQTFAAYYQSSMKQTRSGGPWQNWGDAQSDWYVGTPNMCGYYTSLAHREYRAGQNTTC
jgi:hypothetical protein